MPLEPKRTDKTDWMSDLLAHHGYLVSGHSSLVPKLGLPPNVVAVIRHFRLYKSEVPDVLLLTLEYAANSQLPNFSAIRSTVVFAEIQELFPSIRILTFSAVPDRFYLDGVGLLTGRGLQEWFAGIDRWYVADVHGSKPVNRSSNDAFTTWTPRYLTSACVINDVDAVLCPRGDTPGVLVELKRPRADVRFWGPYSNDRRNYESCAGIAAMCGLDNRTIAYNRDSRLVVRLHIDVKWNATYTCLDSRSAIMAPEKAIASPLDSSLVMLPHRSKN